MRLKLHAAPISGPPDAGLPSGLRLHRQRLHDSDS